MYLLKTFTILHNFASFNSTNVYISDRKLRSLHILHEHFTYCFNGCHYCKVVSFQLSNMPTIIKEVETSQEECVTTKELVKTKYKHALKSRQK